MNDSRLVALGLASALAVMAPAQSPPSVVHAGNGSTCNTGFLAAEGMLHAMTSMPAFAAPTLYTYYRSVDAGRTWTTPGVVGQPLGSATFGAAGQRAYIVHRSGVHASADAGATWQSHPFPSTFDAAGTVHVDGAVCHVWMQTGTGPYTFTYLRSADGGATWAAPAATVATNADWFVMRPMGTGVLLMTGSASGVSFQHSPDRGATWLPAYQPIAPPGLGAPTLAENGTVLHCAWQTAVGIHYQRSANLGATWLPTPTFLAAPSAGNWLLASVVPVETGAVVHLAAPTAAGMSYWRSTDAGVTWSAPTILAPPPPTYTPATFAASGSRAYVVQMHATTGMMEVRWSSDHGATWVTTPVTVGSHRADRGFGVHAQDDEIWLAWSGSIVNSGTRRSVAVTTDPALPWTITTTYGSGDPSLYRRDAVLAVSWSWYHYVLVTFSWDGPDVQVSTDGGQTWQATAFGSLFNAGYGSFLELGDSLVFGYNLGSQYIERSRAALLFGYQPYGAAKPGTNGIAPRIRGSGQPTLGATIQVAVDQALGGSLGVIGASFDGPADLPLGSGRLLITPPGFAFWGITTGAAGAPGVGTANLPIVIPADPSLHRLRLNCQGFVLDPAAADGFSSTAGLEMWGW